MNMIRYQFDVAALTFECQIPEGIDIQKFLFSFAPFRRSDLIDNPIFVFKSTDEKPDLEGRPLLEQFTNDLGNVSVYSYGSGFAFSFGYSQTGNAHYLRVDRHFTKAYCHINWEGKFASLALTSMLRVVFAQCAVHYGGISIHSSVIKKDGKGYLFLGKSGTGKSTHTRLWLNNIQGTSLLNDDNPICRFIDDKLMVFGSPWSGKTPCYKNESAEVVSFVRLEQAPENSFKQLRGVMAWAEVLPSCSVLKESPELYSEFVQILNRIVSLAIVGHMKCLPNADAAIVCEQNIRGILES